MPQVADEPLHKITIQIYEDDYHRLQRKYGYGWSAEIRRMIRRRLRELDTMSNLMRGTDNDQVA